MSLPITVVQKDPKITDARTTKRVKHIEYAIRDLVVPAKKINAEYTGKRKMRENILMLNIGDPNKYDFDAPAETKDAFRSVVKSDEHGYTDSAGNPDLIEAIVAREKKYNYIDLDAEKIIATQGLSEAISMILISLVNNRKDVILIPGPSYPPYTTFVKLFGGTPIEYKCNEDKAGGWQPDLEDISALLKKYKGRVRGFVVINPNNPTGGDLPKNLIIGIVSLLQKYKNIPLISDEVYDLMTFDGKEHVSPCYFANKYGIPFVLMNGMSKNYLAPGWRMGYMATNSHAIYDGCIRQARTRLCANSAVQATFAKTLMGQHKHVSGMVEKLERRRDFIFDRLNKIDGISCARPGGTFYAFPKIEKYPEFVIEEHTQNRYGENEYQDKTFALSFLHRKHVLCVNGSGFGQVYGKDHFRIVFLPTIAQLAVAFDRLDDFMNTDSSAHEVPEHWVIEAEKKGYFDRYKDDIDAKMRSKVALKNYQVKSSASRWFSLRRDSAGIQSF